VEVDNIDEESNEPPYQANEPVLPALDVEQIRCLVDETKENFQQVVDHLPEPTYEEVVAEEQERDDNNVSKHDDDEDDGEGSDGYYIPD
jgi:hypothetical protein